MLGVSLTKPALWDQQRRQRRTPFMLWLLPSSIKSFCFICCCAVEPRLDASTRSSSTLISQQCFERPAVIYFWGFVLPSWWQQYFESNLQYRPNKLWQNNQTLPQKRQSLVWRFIRNWRWQNYKNKPISTAYLCILKSCSSDAPPIMILPAMQSHNKWYWRLTNELPTSFHRQYPSDPAGHLLDLSSVGRFEHFSLLLFQSKGNPLWSLKSKQRD